MPQKRLKLIQDWVEIVTVNSRSFAHLADSGFQKVVDDKLAELKNGGLSAGLEGPNFTAIKERISYLAGEVEKKIKEEVDGKFVSIMIDFATKHRRSIMGVSLQFVQNGKVVTRSIGMVQSIASNTGENVLDVLIDLLNSFGIKKSRIISITSDDARNLSTMVKILNENLEHENDAADEHNAHSLENAHEHEVFCDVNNIDDEIRRAIGESDDSDSDDELNDILDGDDDFETLIESLRNEYASHTIIVNGVKCAAHTLQLAVRDALADTVLNIGHLIDLCRAVGKSLRKQSSQYLLEHNAIPYKSPRSECKTRWNSTYHMVRKYE